MTQQEKDGMKHNTLLKKITCLTIMVTMIVSVLVGCGKDNDASSDSAPKMADATGQNDAEKDDKDIDAGSEDETEAASETEEPVTVDEDVDEKWIEVLKENGTFYDAFYSYPKIMKEEKPDHPDNVRMPAGIIRENNDYYIPDMEVPETESVEMSELYGRWLPVSTTYQDIVSDWSWAKEAGVDFHLDLNEDGTCACNMFDGEQKGSWNEKSIPIVGKDCAYGMEGDYLILHSDMGLGAEMIYKFERENKSNSAVSANEDNEPQYLGHNLENAKLYRLARIYEGSKETKVSEDDPETSPKDHFVVMVETDEENHNGYGYKRDGVTDTALYYQGEKNLLKLINEDTTNRNITRTKFETEDNDKLLRVWPGFMGSPDKYYEYELSEDEKAPISHLAVGPNPDRNFEIPEGTHEKAGFYRLDKVYNYLYTANDPLYQTDTAAGFDDTVFGTDSRKYDADVWYVLKEDGTGYMRVWNRYFEVVWDDDTQYYYDISGRHQLGKIVGEIDYDSTFMRMFKDEINEVPEYPDELKDK